MSIYKYVYIQICPHTNMSIYILGGIKFILYPPLGATEPMHGSPDENADASNASIGFADVPHLRSSSIRRRCRPHASTAHGASS